MTTSEIIEITDNNNPASVMHDDPREALAQVHALAMDADVSRLQIDEAKDAEELRTADEIDRAKRNAAQVMA